MNPEDRDLNNCLGLAFTKFVCSTNKKYGRVRSDPKSENKEGSDMGATSRRISTCYAALAACVTAAAAMHTAQAAENRVPTTETTLTEIVATAQYRQQNLQDTPIAITAVTAGMIEH